ncbi:DUF4145 domain-containing protein [uncultured Hyphomonas sp.]|uniref:DUF4145 domain-containing protein n=1 Tax=uncultured Hyphomonas sp. TaxID=225298 RepID=UPI002AAA8F92|nr:DUF4145 domain-containing protein [uncultured Hyphomonas sp.]
MDQDIEIAKLVLEYIRVLVWPALILLLVCMFQNEFVSLLDRMVKWAGPGFSAEFSERAQELEEDVESIPPSPLSTDIEVPSSDINVRLTDAGFEELKGSFGFISYQDIAQINPSLALAGLRMDLEIMLHNLAKKANIDVSNRSISFVLKELLSAEVISSRDFNLAKEINFLCNLAVHGQSVRRQDALHVAESGERFLQYLLELLLEDGTRRGNGHPGF